MFFADTGPHAGQKFARRNTPCHRGMFRIYWLFETLLNIWARIRIEREALELRLVGNALYSSQRLAGCCTPPVRGIVRRAC